MAEAADEALPGPALVNEPVGLSHLPHPWIDLLQGKVKHIPLLACRRRCMTAAADCLPFRVL